MAVQLVQRLVCVPVDVLCSLTCLHTRLGEIHTHLNRFPKNPSVRLDGDCKAKATQKVGEGAVGPALIFGWRGGGGGLVTVWWTIWTDGDRLTRLEQMDRLPRLTLID